MSDLFEFGWRPCPPDDVRRTWEQKGGRWQIFYPGKDGAYPMIQSDLDGAYRAIWRPVHPCRGWNHEAWMWSAATGEALVAEHPAYHLTWYEGDREYVCTSPDMHGLNASMGTPEEALQEFLSLVPDWMELIGERR